MSNYQLNFKLMNAHKRLALTPEQLAAIDALDDHEPQTERKRLGQGVGRGRRKGIVLNVRQLAKEVITNAGTIDAADLADLDVSRPRTRGDCCNSEALRPCPFVGCKQNLFLDVDENNGSIKFNFPDLEPDQIPPDESCSLDIAELGGVTLEEVAGVLNMSRERINQIEEKATGHILEDPLIFSLSAFAKHHTRTRENGVANQTTHNGSQGGIAVVSAAEGVFERKIQRAVRQAEKIDTEIPTTSDANITDMQTATQSTDSKPAPDDLSDLFDLE